MSSFAGDIQIVCLGALTLLIVYTLWLSRYRDLNGHLTVRWLLIQCVALLTIAFWRWLPFFSVTSTLQERELLLMVTVLLFAFVIFLVLDLLVRSSRQSEQIKRLTQELAIQRQRIDAVAPEKNSHPVAAATALPHGACEGHSKAATLAYLWIGLCIGLSAFETFAYNKSIFPTSLKSFLTANYLE